MPQGRPVTGTAAYEHNGRHVGRTRFYEIACDPRRSVAVEACAGAGKTWMLVSRIVRALLAGARPHEILAITFTKKAAGEMRERLHDWLEAWSRAPVEALAKELALRGLPGADTATCEKLRGLHAALLSAGRPVQVRTFHSWFAALLGGAPLSLLEQLGLPSRYELLLDDGEAVAKVWRRFHVAVAADASARADYEASVATSGRFMTQKALATALSKRVEFARADDHGAVAGAVKTMAEQFPQFAAAFGERRAETSSGSAEGAGFGAVLTLAPVRAMLLDAARVLGGASAQSFAARGAELERAVAAGDVEGVLSALLTDKYLPRKFNDTLASTPEVRQAQTLAREIYAARCQHEAWLHHERTTRLARILLREFAALKREHGWIDMNDVERAALEMLSNPVLAGWIQERLDQQVKHLLVDEFQDTNPMQWQALHEWLASYAGAGGTAPSVFVVGDPKQSIYRFRRAEPQVFRAAQAFIVNQLQGDRLSCDHTYRNAPAVLDAVNEVFRAAQGGFEYEGFRAHTTESSQQGAVACLPRIARPPRAAAGAADDPLEWRDSLTVPRETPEERLVTLECRQAAQWIAGELANGAKPGDFMVLARKRDRLRELDIELRALHIPAQQPENTDLCEAPEVQDLAALLDVLVTTSHDLSLARALKSPLFGATDDDLVELALLARRAQESGPPQSWFELLQRAGTSDAADPAGAQAPGVLPPALQTARDALLRWKSWVDTFPPHDALERIYIDGDVPARFAAAAPAPLRNVTLASLRALLGAALQVDGGRYLTPYAFVRALKAGGIEGPSVAAEDVVRLLTVHGAKGLQAPVVLLLDTDGAPPPGETMSVLCEWPGEAPAPWRFAFIASESRPPSCSEDALRVEQEARRREELNGLYVAMTRAERLLVVSSIEPHRREQTTWWDRLQPLAHELPAPGDAVVATPAIERPIELRVLPSIETTPAAAPVDDEDSDIARFGRAMHRLLEFAVGGQSAFAPSRLRRVAREFGLDAATMDRAVTMAQRILAGEGAWAWDANAIDWHGNEVALFHEGELLRLDRLVRRRGGEWWVLDYKSAASPQRQPELLAQLSRYRAAVLASNPGSSVRAAFLTGAGSLVEVP
ncbi:UvrD-helicase domain-containing protein [Ramlibacter sp. GTP1]|uniref:DNA 3'-5' helicase n=2 Tax=Ramlibacter albus TaxID=2079448 RepID=A0A923M9Q1_9BURK|nr:UvrD-helicase domain-containing protein [Ramlibacter albus]